MKGLSHENVTRSMKETLNLAEQAGKASGANKQGR